MVSGERFRNDHGRHQRWPQAPPTKLCETPSLASECADASTVEYEVHALRRRLRVVFEANFAEVGTTPSAHVLAANASSGPIGPSSASSCARYASSASTLARRSSSSSSAFVATRDTLRPASRARRATSSGTVMFTRDMRTPYTSRVFDVLRHHAGGGDGNRTHDLFDATEALCQLSYAPQERPEGRRAP